MKIDTNRLSLVKNAAAAMRDLEIQDINLVLHEIQHEEITAWDLLNSDITSKLILIFRDENVETLNSIIDAGEFFQHQDAIRKKSDSIGSLRLFASHLSTQKALVGQVSEALSAWGVELFVAHESIEPGDTWEERIEEALDACDAGLVFLQPEFRNSEWCDEEVGWMLGRHIPICVLKFNDQNPYGPLGKIQAKNVNDALTATGIAEFVIDWLNKRPELHPQLVMSFITAMQHSPNFHTTDLLWGKICKETKLSKEAVAGLLVALRDNDQVYRKEAGDYTSWIFKLISKQPGFQENYDLAKEVAESRGYSLLPQDKESSLDESAW